MTTPRWLTPHSAVALAAAFVLGIGVAAGAGHATSPASAQGKPVRLTAQHLLVTQRIAQAGVRRANEALGRVAALEAGAGAPGPAAPAAVAPGSIDLDDLSVEVRDALPTTYFAPRIPPFGVPGGPQGNPPPGSFPVASGVVDRQTISAGAYAITFARPVAACGRYATLIDEEPGMITASAGDASEKVVVRTFSALGAPADRYFHLTVVCPPAG